MKSEAASPALARAPPRAFRHVRRQRRRSLALVIAIPPARPLAADRFARTALLLLLFLSALLHLGGAAIAARWMAAHPYHPPPVVQKTEVTVIEKLPPPPPPPKEVPKPEAPKPVPVHRTPVVKLPPPPPDYKPPPPPPPNQPPPPPTPTTPVVIPGLSLSSTSDTGSFAVNVGNTFGTPDRVAAAPQEVKPYRAAEYAPAYEVTENPVDLNNLSDEEMRKYYPPEALRDQLEAEVRARLTIDDDGSVVKVVVVQKAGHGFDDAAQKLLKRKKFKPAKKNGHAVATEIPFTLHFELPY